MIRSLREVQEGRTHDAFALMRARRESVDRNGQPYLDLILADKHASFPAKVWGDTREVLEAAKGLPVGTPVKVRFQVSAFQGEPQLKVQILRAARESDEGYTPENLYGPGYALAKDLLIPTPVIDVETVPAQNVRELPPTVAQALAKYAERGEMDEAKAMSLSPLFGRVVSLAIGDGDRPAADQRVQVLVVPPPGVDASALPEWIHPMEEADLLRAFWTLAAAAETVVTFNGRGFDVPFLIGRSLVHGIEVQADLLAHRYALQPHTDLYRVLGQGERNLGPANLDVWCWAMGIASPKEDMDGSMVAATYERGEIEKIAHYNANDVRATVALYQRAKELLFAHLRG